MNKKIFVSILSLFLFAQTTHGEDGSDIQSDGEMALISAAFSALQLQGESKAIEGQVEAVRILVDAGEDVDQHFDNGGTALIFAVYGGSTETVSLLIDSGADINAKDAGSGDEDRRTALSYAIEKDHAETTSVLQKAGADGNGEPK